MNTQKNNSQVISVIDAETYDKFANNCVCMYCLKHGKIVEKEGKVSKIISCSRFRNKPKAYIGSCKEYIKNSIL